jgi:hypothetical protein
MSHTLLGAGHGRLRSRTEGQESRHTRWDDCHFLSHSFEAASDDLAQRPTAGTRISAAGQAHPRPHYGDPGRPVTCWLRSAIYGHLYCAWQDSHSQGGTVTRSAGTQWTWGGHQCALIASQAAIYLPTHELSHTLRDKEGRVSLCNSNPVHCNTGRCPTHSPTPLVVKFYLLESLLKSGAGAHSASWPGRMGRIRTLNSIVNDNNFKHKAPSNIMLHESEQVQLRASLSLPFHGSRPSLGPILPRSSHSQPCPCPCPCPCCY